MDTKIFLIIGAVLVVGFFMVNANDYSSGFELFITIASFVIFHATHPVILLPLHHLLIELNRTFYHSTFCILR